MDTLKEVIHQHFLDNDLHLNGSTEGEARFLANELLDKGYGTVKYWKERSLKRDAEQAKLELQIQQIEEVLELTAIAEDFRVELQASLKSIARIIAWGKES